MDAGEGLGQADHGRLAAAEPTPDDAVDAKQQLDHLCGAFGGLSDSHHEILVLREFEGLSYREIGDRMGLSRPGVESTLFRARKRLTEEYDELVSGQRCVRIQSIIAAAEQRRASARATRAASRATSPTASRAAAWRSPPGSTSPSLPRTPVRRAIERVAGFLPLPAFLRARFFAGSEQMVPVSEPMAAAWSKAVAVAATLIVAGVGAGVAPHGGGKPPAPKPDKAKPAAAHTQRSPAASERHRASGARSPSRRAARGREVEEPQRRARAAPRSASRSSGSAAEQRERARAGGGDSRQRLDPAGRDQPDRRHAEPDARRPRTHGRRPARGDDAEPAEGRRCPGRARRRLHPGRRRGRRRPSTT